jgi:hopanoid biosynthesis associated protein HpnK
MSGEKRVIINADDFGLSSAVNEAVFAAAESGALSSATIMANMPGFDEAVRGSRGNPRLGIGVHLNILRGRPVCDTSRVPSLTGRDGRFLESALSLAWRAFSGRLDAGEMEEEFAAQIERVIRCGISPTHVDSEKHTHLAFPTIGRAACRAAKRFGIKSIRVAREPAGLIEASQSPSLSQRLKAAFISRQSRKFARTASLQGLRFTDAFFGIALTGRMNADVMCSLFRALPSGTTEVMTHPAANADATGAAGQRSWLDRQRVAEYRALLDPAVRDALHESGASLITYREI